MTWQAISTSITGATHSNFGSGCQDAVLTTFPQIRRSRNQPGSTRPPLFCAVADGLGSRPHSAVASNLAVIALVESFLEAHGRSQDVGSRSGQSMLATLRDAFDGAEQRYCSSLRSLTEAREFETFSGASTLAGVWIERDYVGIVSVGDSFVASTRSDGTCALLHHPNEVGEYANEVTLFGTGRSGQTILVVHDPEIRSVVLSTDGLAEVALSPGRRPTETVAHSKFFLPLYEQLRDGKIDGARLTQLVAKMGERATDDATLAVAWRSD